MNIDLHVHTGRYSPCSDIDPFQLAHIRPPDLDGLVITEHNALWGKDERRELLGHTLGLRIFWGVEISAASGMHYLVYYGLDGQKLNFKAGMDDQELARRVDAVGGAIIPAHTFRYPDADPTPARILALDAVEVWSMNIDQQCHDACVELALARGLPQVAGADAHRLDWVGRYYTVFEDDIATEQELVKALKSKRIRPGGLESPASLLDQ